MELEQAGKIFADLIRIPSVTASEGEKAACDFLKNILEEAGIPCEIVAKTPDRPNLLACLKASDPVEPPMMLISHIDVVAADPAKWQQDPFGGVTAGGRIHGRGTLDTKQLTVMELYAFLELKLRQKEINRDVWFVATIDEEGGSAFGMGYLKEVRPELFHGSIVINEGGGFPMRINGQNYLMMTVGEKGICSVKLTARGQGSHASAPGGDQAVLKMAEALKSIFAREKELSVGSRRIRCLMEKILGTDRIDNPLAEALWQYAGESSIGMRNYRIGQRSNVVPSSCEATLEMKVLPYAGSEEICSFLDRALEGCQVSYEIVNFEKGFESNEENSMLLDLIQKAETFAGRHGFPCRVLPMLALGRTDGRFYGSEDSMVYGFSPVRMEDSFNEILPKVHGPNESITVDSFFFGCRMLMSLTKEYCLPQR